MKRTCLFFATLFFFANSYSQDNDSTLPKVVEDTLFSTSGYKIVIGQDLNIGTGATPDGDFKFIRRNSSGFGTAIIMSDNNSYNKSELSLPRIWRVIKGRL